MESTYYYNVSYATLYPEAFITKGKNRLKQHGQTVYLNNGDEFEFEFFNPKDISIMVKIKINGKYASTRGLLIKPGQRISLDRYIDEAKKYVFNTYEVDGNDKAAQEAIAKNGNIEFEFYDEKLFVPATVDFISIINELNDKQKWNNDVFYSNTPTIMHYGATSSELIGNTILSDGMFTYTSMPSYEQNVGGMKSNSGMKSKSLNRSISKPTVETGRVEKGSKSDTKMTNVDMDFYTMPSHTITWKILPKSQEPVEASSLRSYCPGCGNRKKKDTWKFCPGCGTEL